MPFFWLFDVIINMVIKMKKEFYEKLLKKSLDYGCEYAEIYIEDTEAKSFTLLNSKLDNMDFEKNHGTGIRISLNNQVFYTAINSQDENEIEKQFNNLLNNAGLTRTKDIEFTLEDNETIQNDIKIEHDDYPINKKIDLLKKIDKRIRDYSDKISQVRVLLREFDKFFTIMNTDGKNKTAHDLVTRITCIPIAEENDKKEDTVGNYGKGQGYEFLDDFNYEEFSDNVADICVRKLSAKKFKGGKVPVVIGNGFGAVIFHEACGHALEATAVSENLSTFAGKLNQRIGTDKVTLIDDGTIPGEWGTTLIDSEGESTKKNILIEKGILKSYLVDKVNSKKMNHHVTGSGRRQDYRYAPTSRMNNTYLQKGTDKIEDMIKSIDYGVYCKSLRGGSVDTVTGDFNFSADECYLIEKGKVTDMLTGITLIGKGQEVLKKVEMVSDDLKLATGYCGSVSGMIEVTIGQPTIKISELLIGGQE